MRSDWLIHINLNTKFSLLLPFYSRTNQSYLSLKALLSDFFTPKADPLEMGKAVAPTLENHFPQLKIEVSIWGAFRWEPPFST